MKQMAGTYAFREITQEKGLLAAFRLRYRTYVNHPELRNLIEDNGAQVEIDGFDAYARHYGLYKTATIGRPEKMIGYIRVIWHRERPVVDAIVRKIAQSLQIDLPEKPNRLYVQKSFVSPKHLEKIPLHDSAISICEPGRFILLPAYRSAGLAQFAVECTMSVICELSDSPLGIIDCGRHHRLFYKRNGFTWVAEQEDPYIPSNPLNLLMISGAGVAKQLPDLEERIRRYRQEGCFHHRLGHIDWVAVAYLPMMMRRWGHKINTGVEALKQRLEIWLQFPSAKPSYKN